MSQLPPTCPTCGDPIHPLAPAGNCPRCLLGSTSEPGESAPPPGEDLPKVPRFRLIEEIGEGAFGIVYRAEQVEPVKRPAAVKVMKSRAVEGASTVRFEAERQALARMEHPGVATLFDAGQTASGRPFFAMELVADGVSLNEHARGLELRARLTLFQNVCRAVAHAHQKGIVHRDLKPSNILIGADGEPRVIDFGIAKATEELLTEQTLLTRAGQMMGTPQYMSPEQAAGGIGVDTRADVYSLGAILYEMVAGRPPFDDESETTGGTLETLLRSIREQIPPPPSTGEADLNAIALKALEKEPARRYGTVAELEADVARYLAGEPVSARAPSPLYRLRKFVGRHRLPVAAAALAAVALVVGGIVSALMAARANQASVAADVAEAETRRTFADADAAAASALADEDPAAAAAHLCRALRNLPDHPTAGYQLMRLLADHTFAQEKNAARMNAIGPVNFLEFAAGGEHLVATCEWDGAYLLRSDDLSPVVRFLQGPDPLNYRTYSDVSPDGERVIVGYRDAISRVWSTRDGQPLSPLLDTGAKGDESRVAFGMDSRRVFGLGGNGLVAAYDVDGEGGAPRVWRTQLRKGGLPENAAAIAVSPDGEQLAVSNKDGRVCWLRVSDGKHLDTTRDPAGGRGYQLAFALGGRRLITVTYQGSICVWDARTRELITQQHGHNQAIYRLQVSPDGKRFATSSFDRFARVWNADDGSPVTPLLEHTGRSQGVAFNADGTLLATSDRQRFARVWDAQTGELSCAPILLDASVTAVVFDPSNGDLLAGSRDGMVRRWDIRARTAQPILRPDIAEPQWLAVQVDTGTVQAFGEQDERGTACVRQWSLHEGAEFGEAVPLQGGFGLLVREIRSLNPSFVTNFNAAQAPVLAERLKAFGESLNTASCLAITPDLSVLFACFIDGTGTFFDLATADPISQISETGHGAVTCSEITRDGKLAAASFANGTTFAFDVTTGQRVGEPMEIIGRTINRLVLTSDESRIGASGHNAARIWKFPGGTPSSPVLEHSDQSEHWGLRCRFSPDGRIFATTGARDASIYLWDGNSGELQHALYTGDSIFDLAFSADSRLFHSLGGDGDGRFRGRLRTWETATGLMLSMRRCEGVLYEEAAVSGDGRWLATAYRFREVQIHSEPPRTTVPTWFIDAAEAFTRRRFDNSGRMVTVPLDATRAALEKSLGRGGPIGEWADWLFSEPDEDRSLAPGIEITRQPSEPRRTPPFERLKEAAKKIGIGR